MTNSTRSLVAIAATLTLAGSARAADCKPVRGLYTSTLQDKGCTSPVGICTSGKLTGDIEGTYVFTMTDSLPQNPYDPGHAITFYKGASAVSPKSGGTINLRDYGTVDMRQPPPADAPGLQAALLTVEGGTGRWVEATGYLQLVGGRNPETGAVEGEYRGALCTR